MRIIGGAWRGRRLATVGKGDRGAHLRPTPDRVRESLFSMLEGGRFGDPLSGARVLDLFAGTGALGLEALSRGAETCTFVDSGRTARRLLSDNIAALLPDEARSRVLSGDATRMPPADDPATLVFLDPPYGKGLGEKALLSAAAKGWIAPGALIVWEDNARHPAPNGFSFLEAKRYGDTWITFLSHDP